MPGRGEVTLPTVATGSGEFELAANQRPNITLLVQADKPSVGQ